MQTQWERPIGIGRSPSRLRTTEHLTKEVLQMQAEFGSPISVGKWNPSKSRWSSTEQIKEDSEVTPLGRWEV